MLWVSSLTRGSVRTTVPTSIDRLIFEENNNPSSYLPKYLLVTKFHTHICKNWRFQAYILCEIYAMYRIDISRPLFHGLQRSFERLVSFWPSCLAWRKSRASLISWCLFCCGYRNSHGIPWYGLLSHGDHEVRINPMHMLTCSLIFLNQKPEKVIQLYIPWDGWCDLIR